MNTKGKSLGMISILIITLLVLSISSVFSQQGSQQGNKEGQVAAKNPCDELARHNKEKPTGSPKCEKELQEALKAYEDWNNIIDKNSPLIEQKKQQIQNKQNQIEALKQQLNNERLSDADKNRILEAIARLEAEIATLQAELEALRAEIDAAFDKYIEKVNDYNTCLTAWADWEAEKAELEKACTDFKNTLASKPQKPQNPPGPTGNPGTGTGPVKWSVKVCCEVENDNPSRAFNGGPNRYYYETDTIPPPSCTAPGVLVPGGTGPGGACTVRTICCAYPRKVVGGFAYSLEFAPNCPNPGNSVNAQNCNTPS